MNQIVSEFRHPVLNKTISELLLDCEDKTIVNKYKSTEYSFQEI